jgi:molecular chaperone DnaK
LAAAGMKVGEALYKAQQAAEEQAKAAGATGAKPDGKVVDADFEEIDPSKKKPG